MNLGTGQLVLGGIGTLGNLLVCMAGSEVAKEQVQLPEGYHRHEPCEPNPELYYRAPQDRINSGLHAGKR